MMKKMLCVMLGLMTITAVGCERNKPEDNSNVVVYDSENPAPEKQKETEVQYEEVKIFYGESATYGDMTVTVHAVEDPEIAVNTPNKMAVFFKVTIENGTDDTVTTNYLNNFALTVDGSYYEAAECFTIPVMKVLYDYYGNEAFKDEIPAGESFTGYLAAEVNNDFEEMQLHYIPKTTDRGSRISVSLTRDDMTPAEK